MNNTNSIFQSGDMEILKANCDSEIRKFYAGKNVLITGCTGFLGTLILEKLLRTCTVCKIYVIVRPKKGLSIEELMKKHFENTVFNELRKMSPNFTEKVVLIQGNLSEASLGLCAEDRRRLVENVNIIIHNAAIVKFAPKASVILRANVIATQEMLELATECSHLEAFVYISTAYSHPDVKDVEEKCYPPPADLKFVEDIIRADEDNASGIRDEALGDILKAYINLYAFSKATAEGLVQDYSRTASFPCIIFRPSIVHWPYKGPARAWLTSLNGSIGLLALIGMGLVHILPGSVTTVLDNVPGDMTIDYLLALIWDHVTHRKSCKLEVYNYGSSDWNPMNLELGKKTLLSAVSKYPNRKMVWYPTLTYIPNYYVSLVIHTLLATIPAAIYDLIRIIRKKKTIALNVARTATKLLIALRPFLATSWVIRTNKAKNLLSRMNAADLEEFSFDLSLLDWHNYLEVGMHSLRIFFKQTPNDFIIAKKKYRKLQILHYTVCSLFVIFLLFVFYKIACSLFCGSYSIND